MCSFVYSAHASAYPWEGQNALDAAVLAYQSVSVLRQQIKPDHRVHGIIEGKNWAPNGTVDAISKAASFKVKFPPSYSRLCQVAIHRPSADLC